MRLKDKVAIVTGGASGFGAGIVRKFVAEGARVVIADRNLEGALDLALQLGEHTRALRVDVADAADVRLMMEAAELHFGRLDILVNNAGVTHLPQLLEEVSGEDFDRIVAVKIVRPDLLTDRRALKRFGLTLPNRRIRTAAGLTAPVCAPTARSSSPSPPPPPVDARRSVRG